MEIWITLLIITATTFLIFQIFHRYILPASVRATLQYIDANVVYEFTTLRTMSSPMFDFRIIDVRNPNEFKREHIEKSLNLNVSDIQFKERVKQLERNHSYVICAEREKRSQKAAKIMLDLGFKDIYVMSGGLLEWTIRDLPVVYQM